MAMAAALIGWTGAFFYSMDDFAASSPDLDLAVCFWSLGIFPGQSQFVYPNVKDIPNLEAGEETTVCCKELERKRVGISCEVPYWTLYDRATKATCCFRRPQL